MAEPNQVPLEAGSSQHNRNMCTPRQNSPGSVGEFFNNENAQILFVNIV